MFQTLPEAASGRPVARGAALPEIVGSWRPILLLGDLSLKYVVAGFSRLQPATTYLTLPIIDVTHYPSSHPFKDVIELNREEDNYECITVSTSSIIGPVLFGACSNCLRSSPVEVVVTGLRCANLF